MILAMIIQVVIGKRRNSALWLVLSLRLSGPTMSRALGLCPHGIFESPPMNFSAVTRNMRTTHALLLRARTSGPGVHGLTPLATHIKIQRENGGLPGND